MTENIWKIISCSHVFFFIYVLPFILSLIKQTLKLNIMEKKIKILVSSTSLSCSLTTPLSFELIILINFQEFIIISSRSYSLVPNRVFIKSSPNEFKRDEGLGSEVIFYSKRRFEPHKMTEKFFCRGQLGSEVPGLQGWFSHLRS